MPDGREGGVALLGWTLLTTWSDASAQAVRAACDVDPAVPGHAVAIGYGQGSPAEAATQARNDARNRLVAAVCARWRAGRCDAVRSRVLDWAEGPWDRRTRTMCASAALHEEYLLPLEAEGHGLQEALDELAAQVPRGRGVEIGEVRWAGPVCGAAEVPALVRAHLHDAMARRGAGSAGQPVRLDVTLARGAASAIATVDAWDAGTRLALRAVTFDYDLLGVDAAVGPCDAVARLRPSPVTGSVDGREETHWISGCAMLEPPQPGREASLAMAWAAVTQACRRYERFEASAAAWAEAAETWERTRTGSPSVSPANVSLGAWAVDLSNRAIPSGAVVRHGDRFSVAVTVDRAAHVSVLYENSAGEVATWPETGGGRRVEPGKWVLDPVFEIDDHGGRVEVLHVVALPDAAIQVSPGLVDRLRQKGMTVVAERPPTAVRDATGAEWWGDPSGVARGRGGAVVTLVFEHQ